MCGFLFWLKDRDFCHKLCLIWCIILIFSHLIYQFYISYYLDNYFLKTTRTSFQATKDFIEKVNAKFRRILGPVSWSTAVRFLYARKFDVFRALTLFEQHELTRKREGLTKFDPLKEPLRSELLTGKFTVLVRYLNSYFLLNYCCVKVFFIIFLFFWR